jgi:hypothetical protein
MFSRDGACSFTFLSNGARFKLPTSESIGDSIAIYSLPYALIFKQLKMGT